MASGITGCASARVSDLESDRLFRDGKYDESASRLREGLTQQGVTSRDSLLYLLDLGLVLHTAGKFEESNQALAQAEEIAEIKDYTSLATESATLLTSENIKDYKGEDFEKVLINAFKALNYASIGAYEDALVEARLVNRKLHLMVTEGERNYKQNAFARYLSAILYEAQGEWNDAYVDYKKTQELLPDFPNLGRDLWRVARALGMRDEMERWESEYGMDRRELQNLAASRKKSKGAEIIVIFQNGISPVKQPNPNFVSLPRFFPRYNPVTSASVELNGESRGETQVLHDIESTAIENLDEKYAGLIAKKMGGVLAKELLAAKVAERTGSRAMGELTRLIMYASDQADLRSWNLLPKDLQILRIPVEPGTYTVRVVPNGAGALPEKTIEVPVGKKVFVNYRYVPAF